MSKSLNVIALISGGKDSFYSILHCLQNGHKVVALGNLYPSPTKSVNHEWTHEGRTAEEGEEGEEGGEEEDLNSFMYQTVGHTVIPLYEKALGIPLYRQEISGTAIQTGTSYSHSEISSQESEVSPSNEAVEDETESLIPLLKRIIAGHPAANAISTGAILSTYQRTRIESVALRLGLTPLSYLWKYPILPPSIQASLLEDMRDVELDARIIKVASGGLDESFLWQNVGDAGVAKRIEKSMRRFGMDGDGAVLGEGGEFETLVLDGPEVLFKGRIVVGEEDRKVVREGGGAAWLKILSAKVVMKDVEEVERKHCRIPDLLESRFESILRKLDSGNEEIQNRLSTSGQSPNLQPLSSSQTRNTGILHWSFPADNTTSIQTISEEATAIINSIRSRLKQSSLGATDIISSIIILRSMNDFAAVNKIYGSLFTLPNPPARVTISVGTSMPTTTNLLIHLKLQHTPTSPPHRKALHVQSRSYWAPANIGPYSQAISIPLPNSSPPETPPPWTVSIAGQIALIPHSMALPNTVSSPQSTTFALIEFNLQTILSLQHLWRISEEMDMKWFTSAVVYLPTTSSIPTPHRAAIINTAWNSIHAHTLPAEEDSFSSEAEEERDLWEEKHFAGMQNRGGVKTECKLPHWDIVSKKGIVATPPCFVVEVEGLPRGAHVEWHAILGIVNGSVELFHQNTTDRFTIYQCVFSGYVQTIISIPYCTSSSDVARKLEEALKALDVEEGAASVLEELGSAAYIDISIDGIWGLREWKAVVPCKGVWGGGGGRLAVILVLGRC